MGTICSRLDCGSLNGTSISVHGRHTFISHALAGHRTLAEVRDAAGHANVSITSAYLHIAVEDEAVGNLFDFSRELSGNMEIGAAYGKEFERHKSLWTAEDLRGTGFEVLEAGELRRARGGSASSVGVPLSWTGPTSWLEQPAAVCTQAGSAVRCHCVADGGLSVLRVCPMSTQSFDGADRDRLRRLDLLCDRFEAAWKAGQPLRIEDLLAEAPAELRSDLLEELIALEAELRKSAGQQPKVEDYLARFPDRQGSRQFGPDS